MIAIRLITLFAVTLIICHLNETCADQIQLEIQKRLRSFATAENTEQAKYLTTTLAWFYVIDEEFAKEKLEKAPDYARFRNRVDEWINEDSARWQQVKSRLDYCTQLRNEGRLGTDIDSDDVDVRWVFFIAFGEPSSVVVLPCRCIGGDGACSLWTFTWLPTKPDEPGWELSCRSRPDESYPTIYIPSDNTSFLSACPIWPMANYSRFPAGNGHYDLWFSVWVQGNQLTRRTLDSARLSISIVIYDSSRTIPVISGENTSDLQLIRGVLEATEAWDRYRIRAMGYIGFADLSPGRYNAHVIVKGARHNDGDTWLEIDVPASLRTSDLLLVERNIGVGENIGAGIIRGSRENLFDNPEAVYARGEQMTLYVESERPMSQCDVVEIWVTLLPMPERTRKTKTKVSTGRPIVVADSLDNPILEGKWQTPEDRSILDEFAAETGGSKAITLLRKQIAVDGDEISIELAPKLKSDLKVGQYVLSVSIFDPKHKSDILTSRRLIRVAASTRPPEKRSRSFGQ